MLVLIFDGNERLNNSNRYFFSFHGIDVKRLPRAQHAESQTDGEVNGVSLLNCLIIPQSNYQNNGPHLLIRRERSPPPPYHNENKTRLVLDISYSCKPKEI
jgi:hypothetical protein